ncbi:hypothetical protein GOODEAATRI_003291, partial [Goodea atripinnis]
CLELHLFINSRVLTGNSSSTSCLLLGPLNFKGRGIGGGRGSGLGGEPEDITGREDDSISASKGDEELL